MRPSISKNRDQSSNWFSRIQLVVYSPKRRKAQSRLCPYTGIEPNNQFMLDLVSSGDQWLSERIATAQLRRGSKDFHGLPNDFSQQRNELTTEDVNNWQRRNPDEQMEVLYDLRFVIRIQDRMPDDISKSLQSGGTLVSGSRKPYYPSLSEG
jgi:hypothetical protein